MNRPLVVVLVDEAVAARRPFMTGAALRVITTSFGLEAVGCVRNAFPAERIREGEVDLLAEGFPTWKDLGVGNIQHVICIVDPALVFGSGRRSVSVNAATEGKTSLVSTQLVSPDEVPLLAKIQLRMQLGE